MSFDITPVAGPGEDEAFRITGRTPATGIDALADHHRALIDGPVTVTLATHDAHGRIQLTPMWFRANADRQHVEINTVKGRAKDRHMRRDPRVTIQATDPQNPYHWVTVYGEVVDIIEESDPQRGHLAREGIDDLAELYLGQRPYPFRAQGEERVLFMIRPTQITTFGAP